jgi:inorganic pyrophosphatase
MFAMSGLAPIAAVILQCRDPPAMQVHVRCNPPLNARAIATAQKHFARTPRGSRAKLEFDPKLGVFTLAKPLLAGLTYPYDWGFIPSTEAEDGDPLDVLIIHDAATYPGLVLKCKPIGLLEVIQSSKNGNERNDRVFVVPDRSPFEGNLQDIRRLPARAIEELEKFFEATNALESQKLKFHGWHGPAKAIKTIKKLAV